MFLHVCCDSSRQQNRWVSCMLIRKKPSEICICTWASVQSFSKPVLKCIFSLYGPLLYFVVPRGLFCIGGETPIHQSSGSAINMQHLEYMSWMTSWQCLRMCGPSLCLSLKRRKAPSRTLCQTVQEIKERRMGNLFFFSSLFLIPWLYNFLPQWQLLWMADFK